MAAPGDTNQHAPNEGNTSPLKHCILDHCNRMMNESGRALVDRDKIPSPLNFKWSDEDPFADGKGRNVLASDPFVGGDEGSLGEEDPGLRSEFLGDTPHEDGTFSNAAAGVDQDAGEGVDNTNNQESASRKRASTSSNSGPTPSRRKKKPKGMPKRPLSAYNLFFQSQRVKILDDNSESGSKKIGFEELGRVIGKKWKSLSTGERKIYVKLAEKDNIRYRKEMDAYNEMKTKKLEEADKLSPIDLEEPPPPRRREIPSITYHSPPQQPKFLHLEGGLAIASVHSAPKASFTDEFSRQTIPSGAPPAVRQVVLSSYPPSITEVPQGQYRPQYVVEAAPQRPPSTATGAPRVQLSSPSSVPIPPPPPPVAPSIAHPTSFPVPPGMEMTLSQGGTERKYRVQYTCYSMSRDAAHQYVESLVSGAPSNGRQPQQHPQSGTFQGSWGA